MTVVPDRWVPMLPFLLPAALIGYALIVSVGGTVLRRKRRRDEAARRKADPRQPWHHWIDDINCRNVNEKKPGAIEKWRE